MTRGQCKFCLDRQHGSRVAAYTHFSESCLLIMIFYYTPSIWIDYTVIGVCHDFSSVAHIKKAWLFILFRMICFNHFDRRVKVFTIISQTMLFIYIHLYILVVGSHIVLSSYFSTWILRRHTVKICMYGGKQYFF